MDTRSLQLYKDALNEGNEKMYNIRVMVVGQYGVGKTTLTKRLLGKNVNISERHSTEGIDVHVEFSKVSLSTGEWTTQEKNVEQFSRLENSGKLDKNTEEYAALSLWDFAGPYVFNTTHQIFLTRRAIYLLVIDLSQHVTDLIDDEHFLDAEGIKPCKVHEQTEIWLNSIHSCASSSHPGIPPVILVGTHVDKIPEKFRQKLIDKYFMEIRRMLKYKPLVFHLMDNIEIDNTQCDPNLERLKRRIFQLASQQPHWGEEKPARWLPLEQAIMKIKASGLKVAPLSLIEEINTSSSIKIEDRDELEVFLNFQHDIGTILYFNAEGLRQKIILDPQWMIDALSSLITAQIFIMQYPALIKMWLSFKNKGKLTHELIDAIWTKKEKPDFHDNKEYLILVMEKLNIITRPTSYIIGGTLVKKEDYYLAPFIVRQETPREMICPKSGPNEKSTSALCFVCKEKFLPPPIFHRLIGACLTHWPIAKQNEENLIYCGCCVFDINNYHRLSLHFLGHVIFARVTIMGVTDISKSSKLCSEARKFIFENLLKIIGNLGQSLEFEPHIQYPDYDAYSLEGMIAVTELQKEKLVVCHSHAKSHTLESQQLLKFWFEDGEQTAIEGKRRAKVDETREVREKVSFISRKKENLHQTVLNRCQSKLILDLNVEVVMIYIMEKELFDDVTIRDINTQDLLNKYEDQRHLQQIDPMLVVCCEFEELFPKYHETEFFDFLKECSLFNKPCFYTTGHADGLREKIVLDPQWMIDVFRSLITAKKFIEQNPTITNEWFEFEEKGQLTHKLIDAEKYSRLQRLVRILNEHSNKQESKREQVRQSEMADQVTSVEYDNAHTQHDQPISAEPSTNPKVKQPSSQPVESTIVRLGPDASSGIRSKENEKYTVMKILKQINENSGKLEKDAVQYAALALWDFAGQYAFYTTHQTFLSSRALYLLVIDLSQQVTDLIDDECFLDAKGKKLCNIPEMIEIWLNMIHSCAPSSHSGNPPVILVGTHVDKIPEKNRLKVIDEYFMKIRQMLKNKPLVFHLMDDIAIDNTQCDPSLEKLKRRIFQLASEQPHWGEEKPARWLPLEQAIVTMKDSNVKVAPLSLIEEINRSSSIKIEDRSELEVFLNFQHDIGTILYFNADGLREKIVLDPQWMIDVFRSLITAKKFIEQNPTITNEWFEFEEKGQLTHKLIDAIWTKKEKPDFHDNKEYLIRVMKKLNIIARPMSYTMDGKSVKKEDYYLAPCILRQETPREMICPESGPNEKSTSALCFVCKEKCLPPPIFHRLVGACLTHWPIAKQDEENLIYCGCCVFDINNYHRLSLHFLGHVIFARVKIMGVTDISKSSKLCSEARKFISENLLKIIGNLGQSLEFDPHIQCPGCDADSLKGMIAVPELQKEKEVVCHSHDKSHTLKSQQLLKFWFEDGTAIEGKRREERFKGDETSEVPEKVPTTSRNTEKLHETVLNRCRSKLIKDLNVEVVMMYIQEKELFDDVTIRDINEEAKTTRKISHLIDQIKQGDQDKYEKFKECLFQAKQEDLKKMLEEEEKVDAEMKQKHQDPRAPEPKRRSETSASKKSSTCLLM